MMMRRTVVSALSTLLAAASLTLSAYAQQSSTAFTYQGFLRDNGQPANGVYDLRFALYDSPSGGNQIGRIVLVEDVTVADGLFTVEVDFGAAPFNTGARRWERGRLACPANRARKTYPFEGEGREWGGFCTRRNL